MWSTGFAVGKLDLPPVDILPGKVTDVELDFDEPGTYTFYCTRWCGLNHWRMRGTIEVAGESGLETAGESGSPLYAELGLDLDAPRSAAILPAAKPLAAVVDSQLSAALSTNRTTRSSPSDVWQNCGQPHLERLTIKSSAYGLRLAGQHNPR
jgi:hypothetical protein